MLEAIKRRKSVRTYADRKLESELKEKIEKILDGQGAGFFGNRPRFTLVEKRFVQKEEKVRLGTYGFIKGAQYFIAGALAKAEWAETDYGYQLENIILEMTRMGLGTCWIGGTLNRKEYAKVLKLEDGDFIPAISALGYAANRRGIKEKIVRFGAKADQRMPWSDLFFNEDLSTPLSEAAAGSYADVLAAVRIAPSASNKQPWRLVKDGSIIHLFLVRNKGYSKMVSSTDLQMIDMGIAMRHFEAAAGDLKLAGHWETLAPDIQLPDLGSYVVSWIGE